MRWNASPASRPARAPCWASCQAMRDGEHGSRRPHPTRRRRPGRRPSCVSCWLPWHSRASTLTSADARRALDVVGQVGLPQQQAARTVRRRARVRAGSGDPVPPPARRVSGTRRPGGRDGGGNDATGRGRATRRVGRSGSPGRPRGVPRVRRPARRRRSRGRAPGRPPPSSPPASTTAARRHSAVRVRPPGRRDRRTGPSCPSNRR